MGLFDKGPSASEIANQQGRLNSKAARETAALSAVDQFSPFGSTTFMRDTDGVPTAQNITLSPELQRIFNANSNAAGTMAENAGILAMQLPTDLFDASSIPDQSAISQDIFDARMSLLRPELDRQRELTNVGLANRGIPINSQISEFERNRMDQAARDALFREAVDADSAARTEHQRLFQNEMAGRTQNINEIGALISGAPSLPTPSFAATAAPNVAAPNVASAHQIANQQQGQLKSGVGSAILGAGNLGLSFI